MMPPDLSVLGRSGPLRGRRLPHHKAQQCLGLVVGRIPTVARWVLLFACVPHSSPIGSAGICFLSGVFALPKERHEHEAS